MEVYAVKFAGKGSLYYGAALIKISKTEVLYRYLDEREWHNYPNGYVSVDKLKEENTSWKFVRRFYV